MDILSIAPIAINWNDQLPREIFTHWQNHSLFTAY